MLNHRRSLCAVATAFALALAALPVPRAYAGGVYFVKEGDTLSSISRVFEVTVAELRSTNRLKNDRLALGDRLRIPDPKPQKEVAAAPVPSPVAIPPETSAKHEVDPALVRQALCREETVYHSVAKGETLSAIGRRYDVSVESLLELNRLRRRSRLSIGQRLVVRRTGPRTHVVRRGETYQKIGARYDINPEELQRLNATASSRLAIGQRLLLEPCDRFAAAGNAPPPLAGADESTEFLTAVAQASAQAAREADQLLATLPSSPAATTESATPSIAQRVIDLAKTMLNIPYRFGGTTLRGIDCSAYVQRVFSMIDLQLPRTAREQFSQGLRIGRDELSVGDLVFFRTYASYPSHVGIYLGDNLFIHASSVGRRVTIDSLDQNYYTKRFLGGRRLLENAAPDVASAP